MIRNNRGWVRLIEVVLAAALVFFYFMYLQNTYISEEARVPESDTTLLKMHAQDVARVLNRVKIVDETSPALISLNQSMLNLLPPNVGFNLYKRNVSSSWYCLVCDESIPSQKEIVSVDHIVAEQDSVVTPKLSAVRLIVWFKQ